MSKLIFGCGYLGRRVAERWLEQGETVHAVTRSCEHGRKLAAAGLHPLVADVGRPATLVDLPEVETVLYAVGFDRAAGRSMHEVYVDGLGHVLDALSPRVGKLIYISSTGVYGQDDGDWVDEDTPCRPQREAGRVCLAAEQLLQAHPLGSRAVILRLAGIYGPRRVPRQHELLAGTPLPVPAAGYLNLIHVDDAAAVVLAAEHAAKTPRLYVVSDGTPVGRGDYYAHLATLLGAAPPKFETPAAPLPATARAAADKRIRNTRMLAELGVKLAYPSYREGLAAILAAERGATSGAAKTP